MVTALIQSQQKTGMYLLHLKDSFMVMLLGFHFLLGLWSYLRELYFNVTNIIVKITWKVTDILSNKIYWNGWNGELSDQASEVSVWNIFRAMFHLKQIEEVSIGLKRLWFSKNLF